jgi:uncharacterized membrane protein YagU involved in acid resistance
MAMSGMRNVTSSAGLVAQTPPEAVVEQRAPQLLTQIPDGLRQGAVELLHWSFGAVGGAVYGMLPAAVRRRPWAGPAYGLLFWVLFEAGIAPALGLAQAKQTRPTERVAFLADHVLYGVVVASSWPHDQD